MTDNQHQFMLITGKYYPDEDIRILSDLYYFSRYDSNGNYVFYEDSQGKWEEQEFNVNGKCVSYTNSEGYWETREYNKKGIQVYYEDSGGEWERRNNKGLIIDSGNYND